MQIIKWIKVTFVSADDSKCFLGFSTWFDLMLPAEASGIAIPSSDDGGLYTHWGSKELLVYMIYDINDVDMPNKTRDSVLQQSHDKKKRSWSVSNKNEI